MAGKFSLDLARFGAKTQGQIRDAVQIISLELLRAVVLKSPVKTGRFRGNWMVDVNTPPTEVTVDVDEQGEITIIAGSERIAASQLGDSIFIVNNLPYAVPLENGHSQQAPHGMVAVSLAEFPGIVQDSVRKVRSGV